MTADIGNVVTCGRCGSSVAMRINRHGFLQRKVFSFFGIYPWKCGACGCNFFFRQRGQSTVRVRSVAASVSSPTEVPVEHASGRQTQV